MVNFSRKFENDVVLTTKNTEHPGQILDKTHEKSKYRQGGFLTVQSLTWKVNTLTLILLIYWLICAKNNKTNPKRKGTRLFLYHFCPNFNCP